jgi:hypothetical protein
MTQAQDKLQFDRQMLDVYVTGLQAEVEAKLRELARFRENMRRLDTVGAGRNKEERLSAVRVLIGQIDSMLGTNKIVRETLQELKATAEALLTDLAATNESEA